MGAGNCHRDWVRGRSQLICNIASTNTPLADGGIPQYVANTMTCSSTIISILIAPCGNPHKNQGLIRTPTCLLLSSRCAPRYSIPSPSTSHHHQPAAAPILVSSPRSCQSQAKFPQRQKSLQDTSESRRRAHLESTRSRSKPAVDSDAKNSLFAVHSHLSAQSNHSTGISIPSESQPTPTPLSGRAWEKEPQRVCPVPKPRPPASSIPLLIPPTGSKELSHKRPKRGPSPACLPLLPSYLGLPQTKSSAFVSPRIGGFTM